MPALSLVFPVSDPFRAQVLAMATDQGDLDSFLLLARIFDGPKAARKPTRNVKKG